MIDFHDMLWFDKVYDESFQHVFPVFQKLWVRTNHTIASESGYFVALMQKNGIQSSGSDVFSSIVGLSKQRYPEINFSVKDMRDFRLDQKVDLITCMDGCINHVFSIEEVCEVFQSVYDNLKDRGYFYFEFWTENEVGNKSKSIIENISDIWDYHVTQKERRLWNNIHNMMTKIEKDGKIIDILNAYHTSFDYDTVMNWLKRTWFKKMKELSFSDGFSKKVLAFKY